MMHKNSKTKNKNIELDWPTSTKNNKFPTKRFQNHNLLSGKKLKTEQNRLLIHDFKKQKQFMFQSNFLSNLKELNKMKEKLNDDRKRKQDQLKKYIQNNIGNLNTKYNFQRNQNMIDQKQYKFWSQKYFLKDRIKEEIKKEESIKKYLRQKSNETKLLSELDYKTVLSIETQMQQLKQNKEVIRLQQSQIIIDFFKERIRENGGISLRTQQ